MLAVLTTQPLDARSRGNAARVTWKRPRTLTAKTRSQSSSERLSRSFGFQDAVVPALLMSTSRRPNRSSTALSIARTSASSLTSQRSHKGLRAQLLRGRGGLARRLLAARVVDRDVVARARERERRAAADSGRRAGDERRSRERHARPLRWPYCAKRSARLAARSENTAILFIVRGSFPRSGGRFFP